MAPRAEKEPNLLLRTTGIVAFGAGSLMVGTALAEGEASASKNVAIVEMAYPASEVYLGNGLMLNFDVSAQASQRVAAVAPAHHDLGKCDPGFKPIAWDMDDDGDKHDDPFDWTCIPDDDPPPSTTRVTTTTRPPSTTRRPTTTEDKPNTTQKPKPTDPKPDPTNPEPTTGTLPPRPEEEIFTLWTGPQRGSRLLVFVGEQAKMLRLYFEGPPQV